MLSLQETKPARRSDKSEIARLHEGSGEGDEPIALNFVKEAQAEAEREAAAEAEAKAEAEAEAEAESEAEAEAEAETE